MGAAFEPSQSAELLADALRSRVAIERRLSAEDQGEDEARLRTLGDLEGLPPMAKPGAGAFVIRRIRAVLRAFLRPWLAAQTIFNHESARRFQAMLTTVRDLERRTPNLEESIGHLELRLRALEREPHTGARREEDEPRQPTIDPDDEVERMFVHSRLPRPPARVLAAGSRAAVLAPGLRAFGFDVQLHDCAPREGAQPSGSGIQDSTRAIPSGDRTFDVVIILEDEGRPGGGGAQDMVADAVRIVDSGGRLLLSARLDANSDAATDPRAGWSARLAPLVVSEMLVISRERQIVTVSPPFDSDTSAAPACVMIDARRP